MTIPKLRWVIAAMLFLATMINYLDRTALSVVSVEVRREFSLNEQDYSHLVMLFLVAYAIMYAGSGYVVDRLGTKSGLRYLCSAGRLRRCCMRSRSGSGRSGHSDLCSDLPNQATGQPRPRRGGVVSCPTAGARHRDLQCRLFDRISHSSPHGRAI